MERVVWREKEGDGPILRAVQLLVGGSLLLLLSKQCSGAGWECGWLQFDVQLGGRAGLGVGIGHCWWLLLVVTWFFLWWGVVTLCWYNQLAQSFGVSQGNLALCQDPRPSQPVQSSPLGTGPSPLGLDPALFVAVSSGTWPGAQRVLIDHTSLLTELQGLRRNAVEGGPKSMERLRQVGGGLRGAASMVGSGATGTGWSA